MTPTVTVAGRPSTPEERAVLEAIEATGNPDDSGLAPLQVATAMIWLADPAHPLITLERLPHAGAGRAAWVDYARRLHLELPAPAQDARPGIDDLRRHIGSARLWTTIVPASATAAAA